MAQSLPWRLLLFIKCLHGFISGEEPLSRNCCQGDYLPLFQNITFSNGNKVQLYVSGFRPTLIGMWESLKRYSVTSEYEDKLVLDKYGTILMKNIQFSDGAKYLIYYGSATTKSELQVNVMVAPTNHCKPKIKKIGNILMASLENEDCGRPEAYVHWMDHPHISTVSPKVVMLENGKEVGTYYACAETQALSCVKNLQMSDYCTTFTIEGQVPGPETDVQTGRGKDNNTSLSSDLLSVNLAVSVISVLVSIVAMTTGLIIFHRIKKDSSHRIKSEITSLLQTMENKEFVFNGRSNIYVDEIKNYSASRRHGSPGSDMSFQDDTDRRNCIVPYRTDIS